jgi:hypothetical protein
MLAGCLLALAMQVPARGRCETETTVGPRARQTVGVMAFLLMPGVTFADGPRLVIEPIASARRRTIAAAVPRVVA